MASRRPLVCPYCYERIRANEILFRCSGRIGPKDRCATSVDDILAARMGDFDPQPPSFTAPRWSKHTAVHSDCGTETHHRICPHCHSEFPALFGRTDSRLIALIGAKNSGKTVYVTVLLHELMHRIGAQLNASVLGADEWTRQQFENEYEDRLYSRHELHDTTRTAAAARGGRRPLVFTFTIGDTARRNGRVGRTVLSFFDTAGEDLSSERVTDLNVRYLTHADGIILLLDPLQMPGARPHADADAVLPPLASGADTPANVLSRVTSLLYRSLRVPGNRRINKPLAVAFSKMDAFRDLPEVSPLLHEPPAGSSFNESESIRVHRHIRALLREWESPSLDNALASHFARYRFFGLSALGESPRLVKTETTTTQRAPDRGIQPWRVEDPFLWLLSQFGIIAGIK